MPTSQLHDLTALEQGALLAAGELSPTALVDHYLDRIAALDGDLRAFITVTADHARRSARDAARRLREAHAGELGPLFGVPIAIKDLHATAGIATTMGSAALKDWVPTVDDRCVAAIRGAGLVLLGKTNAPEFGPCCYTDTDLIGETATPWDLTRSPSGSSGGSAAAVAAGMAAIGHSSDGAGSTRTPASTTGLVGFKPSRGVVPTEVPAFMSVGTQGPLGRTVADTAALLDVMAQPGPGDLHRRPPRADGRSYLDHADPDRLARPLRIGSYLETGLAGVEAHPECRAAVAAAERLLVGAGHEVVPCEHPLGAGGMTALAEPLRTTFCVGVGGVVEALIPPERRPLLRPYTRYLHGRLSGLTALDYARAQAALARAASAALKATAAFDAVLCPTATAPPVPLGYYTATGNPADEPDLMLAWSAYTPLANLTGQPSVSLPTHLTPERLPVGVMLTAAPGDDALLTSLAAQLERAAGGWHTQHPDCW